MERERAFPASANSCVIGRDDDLMDEGRREEEKYKEAPNGL